VHGDTPEHASSAKRRLSAQHHKRQEAGQRSSYYCTSAPGRVEAAKCLRTKKKSSPRIEDPPNKGMGAFSKTRGIKHAKNARAKQECESHRNVVQLWVPTSQVLGGGGEGAPRASPHGASGGGVEGEQVDDLGGASPALGHATARGETLVVLPLRGRCFRLTLALFLLRLALALRLALLSAALPRRRVGLCRRECVRVRWSQWT
jgi:hypothetical protein